MIRTAIAKMAGYVPGEQPQSGKFIKLNTNENPYPPSARVIQAIQQAAGGSLARYPDPLADAFRIRVAQLWGLTKDWILCGNGSDDILTIVTRAFVGQGESLRLPYPSYILYRSLAEIQGAASHEVQFRADWSLPDAFGLGAPDLKLVFLPNPNSPSGTVLSPARVLQFAESLPCPLLVDEAYADFAEQHCVDLVARCDRLMVARTLSKSYSLAGLRFGYLIAQPHWIAQLIKVKDSYNCDALSIAGATAAIDDQSWRADNRARILATRGRLSDQLGRLGFTIAPSQANFLWCTRSDQPLRPIYEQLKARQILVRYMDYPGWGDGLRITVGTDDQVDACVSVIESLL
jgi:histidinol-phosphate aminotransferase